MRVDSPCRNNITISLMFSLTYIYHDCFLFLSKELAIVFDFWKDPISESQEIPDFVRDLPDNLPLYVFVSHFHKDHFNPDIFKWSRIHPSIRYIISRDVARSIRHKLNPSSIYRGEKIDASKVTVLAKPDIFSDSLITVNAFGSTDVGNSYAVTLKSCGLILFHAGDLNCWTWRDESTPEEIASAEKAFLSELKPIREVFPAFDFAMFPVDSRIGTGYDEGARTFIEKFDVKRFFPMHFELADDSAELLRRHSDAQAFCRDSHLAYDSDSPGEFIGLTNPHDVYSVRIPAPIKKEVKRSELTKSWYISAGDVNAERRLSLPLLISRLIDIATAHANELGIGNSCMPENHYGWVLSRVCVDMREYPAVDQEFYITTWIENWNRHFSERSFSINGHAGNAVGYARQIWMVLDTNTRANAGLSGLSLDESLISGRECPVERQGKHRMIYLPEEASEADRRGVIATAPVAYHTFRYSDLDAYRHVNTIRYIELLMNQFTLSEHDKFYVSRIEISFLDEGYYGETVEVLRSDSGDEGESESGLRVTEFLLRDKVGRKPVIYAKVRLKPRSKPFPTL